MVGSFVAIGARVTDRCRRTALPNCARLGPFGFAQGRLAGAAVPTQAWTGEGARPHTCTAIAPGIRLIYIEQDVHHWRTIRTSGSDHGAVAGSGRMPVGSRTDL